MKRNTIYRVKCKICNLAIDGYGTDLIRHLHLKHHICIKKKDIHNHFIATDNQEAPFIINKAVLKQKNKMANLKFQQKEYKSKSITWKCIIKTPCGSK